MPGTLAVAGDFVRASDPLDLPLGILGSATPITTSVGPTSGTAELDVITAPAVTPATSSRRLRIRFHARGTSGGTGGEQYLLRIKEGSTTLQEYVYIFTTGSVTNTGIDFEAIVDSPTAAAHTYKVTIARTSGAGTLSVSATATGPITLTVEDCGAV